LKKKLDPEKVTDAINDKIDDIQEEKLGKKPRPQWDSGLSPRKTRVSYRR
jgi:hypothetical protein